MVVPEEFNVIPLYVQLLSNPSNLASNTVPKVPTHVVPTAVYVVGQKCVQYTYDVLYVIPTPVPQA